jgi:hypothetical protein
MAESSEITKETKGAEKGLSTESLRVSDKLTITAIPLERREGFTKAQKEAITEAIKGSDGVIFEYFPEETKSLISTPFLEHYEGGIYKRLYEDVMAFFGPLADLVKKHEKPAYVFDPAYDAKFSALFTELPAIINMLGGITMGSAGILGFLKGTVAILSRLSPEDSGSEKQKELEDKIEKENRRKVSRRQFIAGAAGAAGAATLSAVSLATMKFEGEYTTELMTKRLPMSRFPSEAKFRRAIIAKGISQLGESLDRNHSERPRNLLLFYPPLHWEGIKGLLEDRKRLEEEFNLYSLLKQGGLKGAFFTARKYDWTGSEWSLEKAEIGGNLGPII